MCSLENLKVLQGACATFGVFDGVHEGHQFEIAQCINDAKASGRRSVIITFDIDPDELFVPKFKKLLTNQERIEKLKKSGVDCVVVLKFNDIKNLDPQQFLDKVFKDNAPASLHIGNGFKFGKNQSGNVELLVKWGKQNNMKVKEHSLLKKHGEVISSTKLRERLNRCF